MPYQNLIAQVNRVVKIFNSKVVLLILSPKLYILAQLSQRNGNY